MKLEIDNLLRRPGEWLRGTGPDAEIVISSRVRLARNLRRIPFPGRASEEHLHLALEDVRKVVGEVRSVQPLLFLPMDGMEELDRQLLVERHLISKEFGEEGGRGAAVAVGPDEVVSVMINEEDHVRIQVIQSGFRLEEAWMIASRVDDEMEAGLEYAFSPRMGYLTACPTNVGTGIRVSVMLHLPALVMVRQINQVLQAILKLGMAIRGFYGEGTEASGNLFQISNQVTLGKSEEEILSDLGKVIRQIVGHERKARKILSRKNPRRLEDQVGRAYGILQNARILSSKEVIDLLGAVRMGIDLLLVRGIGMGNVNELFILTQPAHLQKSAGKKLSTEERDEIRATLVRSRFDLGSSIGELGEEEGEMGDV